MAGQEGLEPPTCGFGDRRSTNWSYWSRNWWVVEESNLAPRGNRVTAGRRTIPPYVTDPRKGCAATRQPIMAEPRRLLLVADPSRSVCPDTPLSGIRICAPFEVPYYGRETPPLFVYMMCPSTATWTYPTYGISGSRSSRRDLEVAAGVEPASNGFANRCLRRSATRPKWSGYGELNPAIELGRLAHGRYAIPAKSSTGHPSVPDHRGILDEGSVRAPHAARIVKEHPGHKKPGGGADAPGLVVLFPENPFLFQGSPKVWRTVTVDIALPKDCWSCPMSFAHTKNRAHKIPLNPISSESLGAAYEVCVP